MNEVGRMLHDKWRLLKATMDERQRRLWAGAEADVIGFGGVAAVARSTKPMISSSRLHGLDPEAYLRDLFRVLPYWPRDRFLELCPRDWRATRDRLDPVKLDRELGPLAVPPLPSSEQPVTR